MDATRDMLNSIKISYSTTQYNVETKRAMQQSMSQHSRQSGRLAIYRLIQTALYPVDATCQNHSCAKK